MCVLPGLEASTKALLAVISTLHHLRTPLLEAVGFEPSPSSDGSSHGVFEELRGSLALNIHPDTKLVMQNGAMLAVPAENMGVSRSNHVSLRGFSSHV